MKCMCQFSGPFLVIRTPPSVTVEIQKSQKAKPFVVHIDKVKSYLAAMPKSRLAEPNLQNVSREKQICDHNLVITLDNTIVLAKRKYKQTQIAYFAMSRK